MSRSPCCLHPKPIKASILFSGKKVAPGAISGILQCASSRAWASGDIYEDALGRCRRRPTGLWALESSPEKNFQSLTSAVSWACRKLLIHSFALKDIVNEACRLRINVWVEDSHFASALEIQNIRDLIELNASFEISFVGISFPEGNNASDARSPSRSTEEASVHGSVEIPLHVASPRRCLMPFRFESQSMETCLTNMERFLRRDRMRIFCSRHRLPESECQMSMSIDWAISHGRLEIGASLLREWIRNGGKTIHFTLDNVDDAESNSEECRNETNTDPAMCSTTQSVIMCVENQTDVRLVFHMTASGEAFLVEQCTTVQRLISRKNTEIHLRSLLHDRIKHLNQVLYLFGGMFALRIDILITSDFQCILTLTFSVESCHSTNYGTPFLQIGWGE